MMPDRECHFTDNAPTESFTISPLGAAIVEAMPDRKRVARIKRKFKATGYCPPSLIFTEDQVEKFYRDREG